jgi:hypothetical protein
LLLLLPLLPLLHEQAQHCELSRVNRLWELTGRLHTTVRHLLRHGLLHARRGLLHR